MTTFTTPQLPGLLLTSGGAKHDPSSSRMEVDGQGVSVVQVPLQGSNTGGGGGGVGGDELMSR